MRTPATAVALLALVSGCGAHYTVTRMTDGRVQEGRFIAPDAYSSYLRGAIAQARGDYKIAVAEYENAAKEDDEDPEIWTRIAEVRCKLDPNDMQARYALRRALLRDEDYGPAWVVRAECEIARGVDRVDVEKSAARAAEVDPGSTRTQTLLATVEDSRSASAARARLIALTLTAGDDADAWLALAKWGEGHGDSDVQATAFSRVAALSPTRWELVAAAATRLAGEGALLAARLIAGALADAQHRVAVNDAAQRFSITKVPLVARLAVDAALAAGDESLARTRASTGRISLEEAAARAALLGQVALTKPLALPITEADPSNAIARAALGAVDPAVTAHPIADDHAPAAVAVAYAALHPNDVSTFEPIVAGDALVSGAAAILASRGVMAHGALSAEAAIEADVRAGKSPKITTSVDARHRLLALAFAPDVSQEATLLAKHLASVGSRDPLVAIALVKLAVRAGHVEPKVGDRLRRLAPNDALADEVAGEADRLAAR
ncbi:MAG: hypothetical protein ABI551_11890, partial [Polyangiaceae bacterium]